MAIGSTVEVGGDLEGVAQGDQQPRQVKGRRWVDKMYIGGAKLAGKAGLGLAKLGIGVTKGAVEGAGKVAWKTKAPVAVGVLAIASGVTAAKPTETIAEAKDLIHHPHQKVLDIGSKIKQEVHIDPLSGEKQVSVFDLAFPAQNQQQKENAYNLVLERRVDVDRYLTDDMIKDVHDKYEQKVRDAADANHVPYETMMAIMLWESKGDPDAVSRLGAVGLFQWTEDTARDEGLIVNDQVDQRRDPDIMITAEAQKLAKDIKTLGSVDRAVQAHHMGVQGFLNLSKSYLERRYGLVFPEITIKPGEETPQAIALQEEQDNANRISIVSNLNKMGVSAFEVITDLVNVATLKTGDDDNTGEFLADGVASYNRYVDQKAALGLE